MIPMLRTVDEAKRVLEEMEKNGIKKSDGEDGWKVMAMCEVPANCILAEQFLELLDGFSIGSNDLTQMTLGVDRDSEIVNDIFDERNEAVKTMISHAIKVCRKLNKYVGICGQAPSDYPEFAKWLVDEGIESMSLNPDTVLPTTLLVSQRERGLSDKEIERENEEKQKKAEEKAEKEKKRKEKEAKKKEKEDGEGGKTIKGEADKKEKEGKKEEKADNKEKKVKKERKDETEKSDDSYKKKNEKESSEKKTRKESDEKDRKESESAKAKTKEKKDNKAEAKERAKETDESEEKGDEKEGKDKKEEKGDKKEEGEKDEKEKDKRIEAIHKQLDKISEKVGDLSNELHGLTGEKQQQRENPAL